MDSISGVVRKDYKVIYEMFLAENDAVIVVCDVTEVGVGWEEDRTAVGEVWDIWRGREEEKELGIAVLEVDDGGLWRLGKFWMKLRGWGRSVIGKRKESVKQAEKAKQEMEEEAKTKTSALGHVMLLGNKIGLEDQRAIGVSEGRKCADELGMLFGECSAKTGIGLEESVDQLASVLRARGLDS